MRPGVVICIVLYAVCLEASVAVLAFSHTPKSAPEDLPPEEAASHEEAPPAASGHAAPAASAASPVAEAQPERLTANTEAEDPEIIWVGHHWEWISRTIPKKIWVTGKWSSDSKEVNAEISKNIGDPIEKRTYSVQTQVQAYFTKWVPVGSYVRYFTNEDMDKDVRDISKMLSPMGIRDMEILYSNLRPGAFRADVWRLLKLWAEGGVYLDANINLTRKINDWIDFSKDELVLVTDRGVGNGYWNAMMASQPKSRYLRHAILSIAMNLRAHYYGSNPLSITGPIALWRGVKHYKEFPRGVRLDLEWKDGKVKDKTGAIMARKDGALHDMDPSRHYDPMWHHHQVYCNQKGPNPDNGMCAHG